jgi:hypothetical protein
MVEVAGIEPASENLSRQASTCIVRVLINRQDLPRTGYITGESAKVSLQGHRHSLKLSHYINVSKPTWAMSKETQQQLSC